MRGLAGVPTLSLRSGDNAAGADGLSGRMPMIWLAPLRYERWMFSLLGDGDLARGGLLDGAGKKGGVEERELKAGESIGGLLDGLLAPSALSHGLDPVRFSETADKTGEVACGESAGLRAFSSWPSA